MKVKIGSSAADRRPQKFQRTDPYKMTPFAIEDDASDSFQWLIWTVVSALLGIVIVVFA